MNIQTLLETKVKEGFIILFETTIPSVEFQATRKDFEGDITIVIFPMLRYKKGNPIQIGESIGKYLVENIEEVVSYNVVKGFLNLVIDDRFYLQSFYTIFNQESYGLCSDSKNVVMVEYSSPNTNKPLHLGHVRNNLLGYSVAEILKASGNKVYKTQIINDRGIHICKSMLAWKKYGNSETPESKGMKGDSFVGFYYVKFNDIYKKEINNLISDGLSEEEAKKQAPILIEAQKMLLKWEAGDPETVALWKMMNEWVYDGFKITYQNLGVNFDTLYYESDTYLLGKDVIEDGITSGVFFKKDDGSVWCDLTDEGLDEKLVLRSDGTAVYMTQDIGTAIQRVKDHSDINGMVYTVGNEQDYHFKVLFLILDKLGYAWAKNCYHLSYGMVDLPTGKMKSREGTVVDADDLMADVVNSAKEMTQERGHIDGMTDKEKEELFNLIGMGGLKYYLLKVDPKKRMMFNPEESIELNGNTGPFIQYTHARIKSLLRKAGNLGELKLVSISAEEKEIMKHLTEFSSVVSEAGKNHSPALIANYTYELVKLYNHFYQAVPILIEEDQELKSMRLILSKNVAKVIYLAMRLLGVNVPEKM